MKYFVWLFLWFSLPFSVSAADVARVAVIDFKVIGSLDTAVGAVAAEQLLNALHQVGGVEVVERRLLTSDIEEQELQNSEFIRDDSKVSELGQNLGATLLVSGSILQLSAGEPVTVNARVIDVQGGRVINTASVTAGGYAALEAEWSNLAKRLLSEIQPLSFQFDVLYRANGLGHLKSISDLSVLTSKDPYKIAFQVSKRAWVYVFQVDGKGDVFSLYPMQSNNKHQKNPVAANKQVLSPSSSISFYLDETVGRESVIFIASEHRNPDLEQLSRELSQSRSRGLKVQAKQQNTQLQQILESRGLAGVVEDKPVVMNVPWTKGETLSVLQKRLKGLCQGCTYRVEFQHQ